MFNKSRLRLALLPLMFSVTAALAQDPLSVMMLNVTERSSLIRDIRVTEDGNRLSIDIAATGPIDYQLLPLDARSYVIVRLFPVRFAEAGGDSLMSVLTRHERISVFQLLDRTVMFTLNGLSSEDIRIAQANGKRDLHLILRWRDEAPVLAAQVAAPESAAALLARADSLRRKARHDDAIAAVRAALRQQPDSGPAYFLGGRIRLEMGDLRRARVNFEHAINLGADRRASRQYLTRIDVLENREETTQTAEPAGGTADSDVVDMASSSDSDDAAKAGPVTPASAAADPATTVDLPPIGPAPPAVTGDGTQGETAADGAGVDAQATVAAAGAAGGDRAAVPRAASSMKPYFQLGFLVLILGGAGAWGTWVYRRIAAGKHASQRREDFASTLRGVREDIWRESLRREPAAAGPIADVKPAERKSAVSAAPDGEPRQAQPQVRPRRVQSPTQGDSLREAVRSGNAERMRPDNGQARVRQRPSPAMVEKFVRIEPATLESDFHDRVQFYAAMGYSIEEIARLLGKGKGAVELALTMAGRKNPLSHQGVAIEMDER